MHRAFNSVILTDTRYKCTLRRVSLPGCSYISGRDLLYCLERNAQNVPSARVEKWFQRSAFQKFYGASSLSAFEVLLNHALNETFVRTIFSAQGLVIDCAETLRNGSIDSLVLAFSTLWWCLLATSNSRNTTFISYVMIKHCCCLQGPNLWMPMRDSKVRQWNINVLTWVYKDESWATYSKSGFAVVCGLEKSETFGLCFYVHAGAPLKTFRASFLYAVIYTAKVTQRPSRVALLCCSFLPKHIIFSLHSFLLFSDFFVCL